MAAGDVSSGGLDRGLGAYLLKRKLVGAQDLVAAVKEFESKKDGPEAPALSDILIERKLIDRETLDSLCKESTRFMGCTRCGKRVSIPFYIETSVYACVACGGELEPDLGGDVSLILPQGGGETVLGMSVPGKKPGPPVPAAGGESLVLPQGGGETVLGMSVPGKRTVPPKGSDESLVVPPGGGQTVLGMGSPVNLVKPPAPSDPTSVIPAGGAPGADESQRPTKKRTAPHAKMLGDTLSPKPPGASESAAATSDKSYVSGSHGRKGNVPEEVRKAQQDPKRNLGKYIVVSELGRGGQATVYRAWDSSLAQYVALKIMRIEESADGENTEDNEEVKTFQREAQMAARLRHPNIVRIYELGCVNGKHYLSMELIEGDTLHELIHGSKQRNHNTLFPADPEKYLTVLRDVARAVHYGHAQKPPVIHRDLKPQNVLLTREGIPCVADFGLAKEAADVGRTETVSGVVKGTPSYMAPEQAEGHSKDTDARTDVYSLGAILFEVLTGRPPFVGESVRQVLNQIVTKLPERPNEIISRKWHEEKVMQTPSSTGASGSSIMNSRSASASMFRSRKKKGPPLVARQLETICLKALEKRRADRYQSAKDFASDIDRFLQHLEIEAREPGLIRKGIRKMRAHPLVTGVTAAILLAVAVAGVAFEVARRQQKGSIDQIVNIANEHLGNQDWSALRTDVDNLAKLDPENPRIAEFQKHLADYDAKMRRLSAEWEGKLKKLKTDPFRPALNDLRVTFREAGELQPKFRERLERTILELQTACIDHARTLIGPGPNPEWLLGDKRTKAKTELDRTAALLALPQDPDFAFETDPVLKTWQAQLGRLLAYEGTWTLRINVAPFAEVVLRKGEEEIVQEFTPLGLRELEVGKGYSIDIYWPSRADQRKTAARDLNGLKHGDVVVVSGDITEEVIQVTE